MPRLEAEDLAVDLVNNLARTGYVARIFGGIAFSIVSDWTPIYGYHRPAFDIDLVTRRNDLSKILRELNGLGAQINTRTRLTTNDRFTQASIRGHRLDVYTDPLYLNQTIELGKRLTIDNLTLTHADLLATKLQIVAPTERDLRDVTALLASSELAKTERHGQLNVSRILNLCQGNWGFYHTAVEFLEFVSAHVPTLQLTATAENLVVSRIQVLRYELLNSPKSLAWKAREPFGTLFKWYTEIDDASEQRRRKLHSSD
jgi:hypothetical protein